MYIINWIKDINNFYSICFIDRVCKNKENILANIGKNYDDNIEIYNVPF